MFQPGINGLVQQENSIELVNICSLFSSIQTQGSYKSKTHLSLGATVQLGSWCMVTIRPLKKPINVPN